MGKKRGQIKYQLITQLQHAGMKMRGGKRKQLSTLLNALRGTAGSSRSSSHERLRQDTEPGAVNQLRIMGFEEDLVTWALAEKQGNLQQALELLLEVSHQTGQPRTKDIIELHD